jgi:hypothetical protein
MEQSIENFCSNHAPMFACTVGGPSVWSLVDGEHRLEWTEVSHRLVVLLCAHAVCFYCT